MTEASGTDIGGRVETPVISCDAEASLRSGTYSLLANLLASPPDQGMLDLVTGIDRSSPESSETMLGAAWQMLAAAGERATVSAVDDEYHALFIGLGRGELVPFGSWYVTGFLMEQPLARLRSDLARLGFERREGVSEPEDHVAGLCDVMAILNTEGEVAAYELQREFFERHMLPWMPRFFRDLQEAKTASFYRAVGQLGEQFLEVEKEFLRASAPDSESTRQDGLS
jgi:TorA maturation chaperone TorD